MLAGGTASPGGDTSGATVKFAERQSWYLAETAALLERRTGVGLPQRQDAGSSQSTALAQSVNGPHDGAATRGALLAAYAGSLRIGTALAIARSAYVPFEQAIESAAGAGRERGVVFAGPAELRSLMRMLLRAKRYDAAALLRGGVLPADDGVLTGAAKARTAELAAAAAAGSAAPGDRGVPMLPRPLGPAVGSVVMLPHEFEREPQERSAPALAAFVAAANEDGEGGEGFALPPVDRAPSKCSFEFDGAVHGMLILAETKRGELDRALSLLLEVRCARAPAAPRSAPRVATRTPCCAWLLAHPPTPPPCALPLPTRRAVRGEPRGSRIHMPRRRRIARGEFDG
jgi:hypothetical protein